MGQVTILTEAQLRELVPLDLEAVSCVERAFAALAGGQVVMPPILSMAIEKYNGEVDVKTAYVPGLESFAIKVSPGFFDNPKFGLPSTSGLMMVFSARTGQVEALLLDNGYLTDVRTAAAGAVAAKFLANETAQSVCVMGAGMQARLQLMSLQLVRPISEVVVWARDANKGAQFASQLHSELGVDARVEADAEIAVRQAEIVVTTTPSTEPILQSEWLQPGQHVTAMGSDQHNKNELEPACISRADAFVPDRQSQSARLGELRSAMAAGAVDADAVFRELGDIVASGVPGRTAVFDVTIADLTGTGVQDTAIATLAVARAKAAKVGTIFET